LRLGKPLLKVSAYDSSKREEQFFPGHNAELISAFFVSVNRASYESATLSKKTL
jgi:hypothetical protein